jgi:membrane-associated phospholipid phosphatase
MASSRHCAAENEPHTNRRLVAGTSPRTAGLVHELALVAGAALLYGGVRALTERSVGDARANGQRILDLERSLGIAWEHAAQSVVLPHLTLISIVNWVYIWGHWPVIVTAAVWLYRTQRPAYVRLRNAIFLSGVVGFAFFAFLPALPPRLLDSSFVDTVVEHSHAYRALQPPSLTNEYAAMPSLHFGWNLLIGIALFAASGSLVVRAVAVATPALMAFSVVATANHFVLDVLAGAILVLLALAALACAERIRTLRGDHEDRAEPAVPLRSLRRRPPLRQQRRRPPARVGRVGARRRG